MTSIRWLAETIRQFLSGRPFQLRRLLALWSSLRRFFSASSKRPPPSHDFLRIQDDITPPSADNTVVICSSLSPYHLTTSNISRSSHDLTSERASRGLYPSSALSDRRSRSHTPSARYSSGSSPVDIITSSVTEASPINEESPGHNVLSTGAPGIDLDDYGHLDFPIRDIPSRPATPSIRPASIRTQSAYAPSVRGHTPSLRAPSPSFRVPSPSLRVPSPSLRWSSQHSARGKSPAPSSRRQVPSSVRAASLHGSHCSVQVVGVPRAHLCDSCPSFYTTDPEHLERYDRANYVVDEPLDFPIEPMTRSYKLGHNHDDWQMHTHPEGARYFSHTKRRLFTDADLCDPDKVIVVCSFIDQIDEFMRVQDIVMSSGVDLVLDVIRTESGKILCGYYFADHENKSIFWLDEYAGSYFSVWGEVRGVTSLAHVGHIIESQYWYHCQLFPICIHLTTMLVDNMRDLLIHTIADMVTSAVSTSPYEMGDLQQILTLTNNMKKNIRGDKIIAPGCISSLSRFMYVFVRQRYFHFHGEPSARLERDRSVYGAFIYRRTLLITLFSPLLFLAPEVHLKSLEKIWVDGILNESTWGSFINKLTSEWQEFILYATVLLNANVAFLAIQSVDEGSYSPSRSAAQITSYLSVIASIGSIILGLLLVRQNRSKAKETSRDALLFLEGQKHEMLGLETLAVMYSLPYALLMWGMVSFLGAFSLMCLVASNATVRVLVGCAWAAVGCAVLWCITISWDAKNDNRWYMWLFRFGSILWETSIEKFRISAPPIMRTLKKIPTPWHRPSVDSGQTVV